jgi:tRNA (adenine-N(1)-)-methyltransferase non-catalytic subunit
MSEPLFHIKQGDTVILIANDNKSYICQNIQPNSTIKLQKGINLKLDSLIGKPYYSFYEVDKKSKKLNLLRENPDPEPLYADEESKEDLENDNRAIVDDNRAQQLTAENIDQMKKEHMSHDEIISKLVENSASFAQKNKFSQQKYLKKKKQKYMIYVKAIYPTAHEIARFYMDKKPDKISHLRFDSLAQLLYLGNIYSNTQVMVVETCMGLVTAAVLERLNGYGRILKIAETANQHFHCVKLLNNIAMASLVHKNEPMIVHIPFSLIGKLDSANKDKQVMQSDSENDAQDKNISTNNTEHETNTEQMEIDEKKKEKKKQKDKHEQILIHLLKGKSDSLIIAGDGYDPESILIKLWPYLQTSGTFTIFCPYIQPLQRCYNLLRAKQNGMHALMITLTETWTREQQVLPLRTHPVMRMHATSGYILNGVKIE